MEAFTVNFLLIGLISCAFFRLFATEPQSCQSALNNVEIICEEIANVEFLLVGFLSTCLGDRKISSLYPESPVSSVLFSDRSAVENFEEIEGLVIKQATVRFFPIDITNKLPNLKSILLETSGLLIIDKNDLKELGSSLEYLALGSNSITSIDADLFEFNPNLITISLRGNPIRHIEPELFANLKNMENVQWVNLGGLACMNQVFNTENGHDMETFEWEHGNCFNETARIETRLAPKNARIQKSLKSEYCLNEKMDLIATKLQDLIELINPV